MNISETLGAPLKLACGTVLSNRLAKSAMSEVIARANGDPSDELIRLYERWGRGGAGLLLTGNVMVRKDGGGEPGNVILREDSPLERYREWATAAQRGGSLCFMQINHAGRQAPRFVNPKPVAPSAIPLAIPGVFAAPRALEDEEIVAIIDAFGAAAAFAQRAGFSGVQLHGAHGYLISQFLSPLSNVRTDRWGGSLENRMRFLVDTYRRVRAAVGPNFPVALKLNSADFLRGGITIEESMLVAKTIGEEGMDFIEVSGGTYEKPAMVFAEKASTAEREAHFLEYAEKMRTVVRVPLMLTGGLRTPSVMARIVSEGVVDLIGMARPIALEPDLPREILSGRTEASASKRVEGRGVFAAAKDLSFYQAQIRRMGDGLEPELTMSRWRALGSAALGMLRRT